MTGLLELGRRAHWEPKSTPSTQSCWKVACAATFWAQSAVKAATVNDFMAAAVEFDSLKDYWRVAK